MESSDSFSAKGDEFMKKGRKTLKGSFFGNIMSNQNERSQEAIDYFKQAATNYKLAKRWQDSAKAYIECVQCDRMCKGGQAADFYQEAANVKQKVNTAQCIKYLESAIQLYISSNRMSNVAKLEKRIAQIYDKDGQYTLAMRNYKESAQHYSLEQHNSSNTNTCLLKVVEIGIFVAAPDYGEMIKILEEVADKYMSTKITSSSAKELYFKAVLLYLAMDDAIGADQALKKYVNKDPTFLQTRQEKFVRAIIKSVKEQDLGLYSTQCKKFNEIIPFDRWKTTILTKIKNLIPDQEGSEPVKKYEPEQEIQL